MNQLPPPFNQPEQSITGLRVLSDGDNPGVRIESRELAGGETFFSVTGPLELGRRAIAQQMSLSIAESAGNWREVRKGLASIGYPARRIAKLHRALPDLQRLNALRPASRELAGIIKDNQPTAEYSMKIPVFDFYEAMSYVRNQLSQVDPKWLEQLLTRYEGNTTYAQHLHWLAGDQNQPEYLAIAGLSQEDQNEIRVRAMLGEATGLARVDVLYSLFDEVFEGHLEEPVFNSDGQLRGGGFDQSVFIRKQDIPAQLRDKNSYWRVSIGRRLRDADRPSGLPRHEVSFVTRQQEVVALRRAAWINDAGVRRFVFPVGRAEQSFNRPSRAIGSSVLGAARMAEVFGPSRGIDYAGELDRLVGPRRFGRAGLLALVLHAHQDEILSHPYFRAIETRAVKIER